MLQKSFAPNGPNLHAARVTQGRAPEATFRHPELDAEFAQHLGKQLDTPRTPLGCAWNRNCYQGWLASLAHPWLTCLHASGVQSAARRAVGRLAPGGAQRHPGFKGAMRIARRQACEDPLADHPEFLELRRSELKDRLLIGRRRSMTALAALAHPRLINFQTRLRRARNGQTVVPGALRPRRTTSAVMLALKGPKKVLSFLHRG